MDKHQGRLRMSPDMRNQVAVARQAATSCAIDETALPWVGWTLTEFEGPFAQPIDIAETFLADERLASWGRTKRQLKRSDLFLMAARLPATVSPKEALTFAVNVNAWGFGTTGYGYSRTERIFDRGDPQAGSKAAEAIRILRSEGPVEAYFFLYNKSGNDSGATGHVRNWGPAFFTKFLYFADPGNQPTAEPGRPTALVLDQFLAQAVNAIVPSQPMGEFATNGWTTPQYAFYLSLLRRLARSASTPTSDVSAGMIEAALFSHFAGRVHIPPARS